MKNLLPKICLSFIGGTVIGFYLNLPLWIIAVSSVVLFLFLVFEFFKLKKAWISTPLFGATAFFLFILLGILNVELHLPKNQQHHYVHQNTSSSGVLAQVKIVEELKPDLFYNKYIATVEAVNQKRSAGKVIILEPKELNKDSIKIDDQLLIFCSFQATPAPLNPYQFNYREYLINKGILNQVKLSASNFSILEKREISLRGIASKAREEIISELKKSKFGIEELAIIQALLLGDRKDISQETYTSYADAGVIHLLAVSGLHVGIILLIISWIFSPLKKIRYGTVIHFIIIMVLLWAFAFLAGLSASIIRAVTMFSFVAIGLQLKRRGNILNSIAASMLILLLVNPHYLLEVGFQLSYAAVISIIFFQPLIAGIFSFKKWLPKFLGEIFSVTLAAQIGVLPLSLFYFHQFPGLFFISNLVILPFMGVILGMGILVIFLALLGLLPDFLAEIFGASIYYLNNLVDSIAAQENFIFKNIPFSFELTVACYLPLILLFLFLKKPSSKILRYFLLSIIFVQLVSLSEKTKDGTGEVVVFNQPRHSSIGIKNKKKLNLYSTSKTSKNSGFVQNYLVGENIKSVEFHSLRNVLFFQNEKMLIIDSLGVYQLSEFKPDYVLLQNSPKINLSRLIETLKPNYIIADASNFPSYVKRWKETCKNKKAPFHYTREKGAFIVEY